MPVPTSDTTVAVSHVSLKTHGVIAVHTPNSRLMRLRTGAPNGSETRDIAKMKRHAPVNVTLSAIALSTAKKSSAQGQTSSHNPARELIPLDARIH